MAQTEAEDTKRLIGSPILVRFLIKFWRLKTVKYFKSFATVLASSKTGDSYVF